MKFLRRNKIGRNTKLLCKSDYYVLDYEQLLMVNGAGGSSNKSSSGSPSNSTTTTTSTSSNPSSYDSYTASKLQTPSNPNEVHCDIYAHNLAVENGITNTGDWDGNSLTVDKIYKGFYSGSSKETKDLGGTAGYVFYDWDGNGSYDHMEYYECSGNGNYSIWTTDGISTPTESARNFSTDPNGHAKNDGNGIVKWVPLA